ncbi:hypothetical protein AVEN_76567-1 [Araneus ventricosus]|uniref:Uncharacterized protein n=1 Tax=Araneus ventricosus TaxID=182803 RepID=A0A4Y2N775_ARAVE|nr:hypothetical protein AVEN_76567-1 [Araneus ventricosus]
MMGYFQSEGKCVIQANEEADTLICLIAINACQTSARSVAVIATGCDTTSAIFKKEKSTAFKLIKENQELCSLISQFNIPQLDPLKAIEIGEVF